VKIDDKNFGFMYNYFNLKYRFISADDEASYYVNISLHFYGECSHVLVMLKPTCIYPLASKLQYNSVYITTSYRLDGRGFHSRQGEEISLFITAFRLAMEPSVSSPVDTRVKRRGVNMATHIYLLLRIRMGGFITPLLQ
jgi:hypothetical protein